MLLADGRAGAFPAALSFSARSPRREGAGSVLERYSGALEMLRNQLWSSPATGNVTFEESEPGEDGPAGHLESREPDASQLLPVERDLCAHSAVFLRRLLLRSQEVPASVLDGVLSDERVTDRLRRLNDAFTFGKRLYLPEDELEESVLRAVTTAAAAFNGSCVPAVMWPCTDPKVDHNERVRVTDSAVFEALQIYRLRKHNREVYVEWGRSAPASQAEAGALAVDVTDPVVVREMSDTIFDEVTSTLWCLGYLALHVHSMSSDILRSHAAAILADPGELTAKLWKYYLACSDHLRTRCKHLKDIDKTLADKLGGRLVVETHRVVMLQVAIVKALLDIHVGTRSMSVEEYQRYAAHLESRHFMGAYSVARTVIGVEECASSPLLTQAVLELQALGTMLLSSFFLYEKFGTAGGFGVRDSFLKEATKSMRACLGNLDNDFYVAVPLLVFAYACFLDNLTKNNVVCDIDKQFVTDAGRYLERYAECVEWFAFSRDMFITSEAAGGVTTFTCRMLMVESFSQAVGTFGIENVPRLDAVVGALSRVVEGDDVTLDRGYHAAKAALLDRVSRYLMSQFPFGLNSLFQLLASFLPGCAEPPSDAAMDVDNDCASMELIVRYLLTPFETITVSPMSAPMEYKSDTCDFELTSDLYVGVQLLHMLGFEKRTLVDNWFGWEMGRCLYVLRAGSTGQKVAVNSVRHLASSAQFDPDSARDQLWVVDAGLGRLEPNSGGEFWMQETYMQKPSETRSDLLGCRFELGSAMTVAHHAATGHKPAQEELALQFTLLRALWMVWRGSILHMVNASSDLPVHVLKTFVACNALLAGLVAKYPRVASLIEDHVMSTVHMREVKSQYPFGPSSIVFHYSLLFLLCLRRPQLRVALPDVVEALRSFLAPAYVVPAGDNATEVEFSRYWVFLQSLEYSAHLLADENGLSVFALLDRVMQEEERAIRTFPVTRGALRLFAELLAQCPPELWMLSGWHHGMLNMSHTSLEMESSHVTHGLGLSYLATLKGYVDAHQHKEEQWYSPFQAQLLCELLGYALKGVSAGLGECQFADAGERLEMQRLVATVARRACRIFRVYNYDNARATLGGRAEAEDAWVQGLHELVNRLLLILSESNYIMEVVDTLTHQLDIVHYDQEPRGGSLVMVNALCFAEASLAFFTARSTFCRRMGLQMELDCRRGGYSSLHETSATHRWLSRQGAVSPAGQSRRIICTSLELLRDLYVTALPPSRNPLFSTLAETLRSRFFARCRAEAEQRGRYVKLSDPLVAHKDPVGYFALRQLEMLCVSLPRVSVLQSLVAHTYSAGAVAAATDAVSLYILLREQAALRPRRRGGQEEAFTLATNNRLLLQQLGHSRCRYDVIALTSKDEACFYEHLICVFMDARASSYETRVSILQYFLTALSTCSGMEMLLRNNGLDVGAMLEFVDAVLRYHVLHGRAHNLGDVTLAQYALLVFARLVELSKGAHGDYCWKTVLQALRVLVGLWRGFDSNLFVDADVTFNQQGVVPRSTMVRELWLERVEGDLYVDMADSLLERRLGLLRIMGCLHGVLDACGLQLRFAKAGRLAVPDDFLRLLGFLSMNWDFMDTLFPIVVYDSGFVDTYVKNDVTEAKMRQYYRLGLWLGDDCLAPLSRCLHYLHDVKMPLHHLLLQGGSFCGAQGFDIGRLVGAIVSQRLEGKRSGVGARGGQSDVGVDAYAALLGDLVGPPEANGFDSAGPRPDEAASADVVTPDYSFYSFGTAHEYGHHYLMDVEKFHYFGVVLLTSANEDMNVLLSREMAGVRRCIELVPYVDSLNDLKVRLLRQLCDLVADFRSVGGDLDSRMQRLLGDAVKADKGAARGFDCEMKPFEMFAFNGTMLLQLVLTRPDCLAEHPVYVGLLIELFGLLLEEGMSLPRLESSFIKYYQCCRPSGVDNASGIVNCIVSSDPVAGGGGTAAEQPCDSAVVGQEFRLFAVNVFGGLVAQVARCISEFSERFHSVLDVNFKSPPSCRRSLKVRVEALESCLRYNGRLSMDSSMSAATERALLSLGDAAGLDRPDCVCYDASGKGLEVGVISVWLHFTMCAFFGRLYRLLYFAAKSGHELEPRGAEEPVLDVYQRVTKYAAKSLARSCAALVELLHRENDRLLQCFADAGSGLLREGELEAAHVFVMGPYAAALALEAVVSTEFNAGFLQGKGYLHLLELAAALTALPYTTSACISRESVGDVVTGAALMKRDKVYMAECLRRAPAGAAFSYANRNWLRAMLFRIFERLNAMMMSGVSCKAFVTRFAGSQLFQRLYLYSFLCYFVQPLKYVSPKNMLAKFSDHVLDGARGDCVEVIENNVTMWYPPYQAYRTGAPVRCPYHLLHCGLLRFVADACSAHAVGTAGVADLDDDPGVLPMVLGVLHLLRLRIRHVMCDEGLSLAHLEECHLAFALMRHLPSWRRLSEADAVLAQELLQCAVRYFTTLTQAFQNGVDKLVDQIPGRSVLESPGLLESRGFCEPREKEAVGSAELKRRERAPRSYQQRCLYLALKSAESFAAFLLNLGITMDSDCDAPPVLDNFLKTGDPGRVRPMRAVERGAFQALLRGGGAGSARSRVAEPQSPASPHEMTFEMMTEAFGSCVDLCAWALRLCKELQSRSKDPCFFGVKREHQQEVQLPLSLHIVGRGEPATEEVEGFKCALYGAAAVSRQAHVDVAPATVTARQFQQLLACVIERTALFSARAVNTAFLQNQLCQHEYSRGGQATAGAPSLSMSAAAYAAGAASFHAKATSFHSTVTLLHNALSEAAASAGLLSEPTAKFCAMMARLVERRVAQSHETAEAFGESFIYAER